MKLTIDQAVRKAATLAMKGQKKQAEEMYRRILDRFPAHPRASKGLHTLLRDGKPTVDQKPAETSGPADLQGEIGQLVAQLADDPQGVLDRAGTLIGHDPDSAPLHSIMGVTRVQLGLLPEALASFDEMARLEPGNPGAHRNRGHVLRSLGRLEDAVAAFDRALAFGADKEAQLARGNCLKDLDRLEEAAASFAEVLDADETLADVWYNRGNALRELGRTKEALACYDRAIAAAPDLAEVHNNRGNLLREAGQLEEALAGFDQALLVKPDLGSAYNNRSVVLRDLGRLDEALADADAALLLEPDFTAYNNRGVILVAMNRQQEALVSFDRALRLKPDEIAAYNNAGNALQDLFRLEEAILCYDAAIRIDPSGADTHANRANAFSKLDKPEEAISGYSEALRLKPELVPAASYLHYHKASICDWSASEPPVDLSRLGIEDGAVGPFTMLSAEDRPDRQLARAARWTAEKEPPAAPPLPVPATASGGRPEKLRIGYFSADFYDHATMLLMAGMFEAHDRERFEIHGFSYGPDKQDAMRSRAEAAFDGFHDIRALNDAAAAQRARDLGIDIAVDLKGYTRDTRSSIMAYRAAPVQMSYLGFPGTMSADFIDYIVADRVVLPPEAERFFTEKAVLMPHSYQVNDKGRVISPRRFTRAELGLPDDGFVFCCFNANYKIAPESFDIWMRLLAKVEGSVLWLLEGSPAARANLCREAEARGIDAVRLRFAPRMVSAEHLARHRCADLFLDTFNYNAHTTGSDALWAGLPIVTRLGKSFAARVGASLLHAVGMSELITRSSAEYEELALALAIDPASLAGVKARLDANLPHAPLFDTVGFTRDLERGFDLAFERRTKGLSADHIDLAQVQAAVGP